MRHRGFDYICPACRASISRVGQEYECLACQRRYPILFGIPDFRLEGDRYLSLEDERAKAAKLHAFGQNHDLAELVAYYYSITDDVPDHLQPLFANYVLNGEARSANALRLLAPNGGGHLLDLGCGSGGALAAARSQFEHRTGVDIALRWLVIADKRMKSAGIEATLVCADAGYLPFAGGSFSHVLAADLLENTRNPSEVVGNAGKVIKRGGHLYVSSINANWIGPHPATGVWAAGLLPAGLRGATLRRRYGVDLLRAVTFVTPSMVKKAARDAGLTQVDAHPLEPEQGWARSRPPAIRFLARAYSAIARVPVLRTALLYVGPVFQIVFVKD